MPEHGGGSIPLYPTAACQRFDRLLPDYLEGQDQPEVTAHAAECVFCAALLGDLLLVRASAGEIGEEEPSARLWANVRARLVEEGLIRASRSRPAWVDWFQRPLPAAGFAALLLCGFLSLRSLGYLHRHSDSPRISSVARVDPRLEANVSEMERVFEDHSSTLDPAMKAAYEEGLKALNLEIQECRSSLSRQPDDGLAREYLASAYHEKALVLASALEAGDDR
jgi:hypothetical protein